MQERQLNRRQYFDELAATSKKYFIPYIQKFIDITPDTNILEIGCGDGGNLLPLARMGCHVTGCDMAEGRVKDAKRFFEEENAQGEFIASDVFLLKHLEHKFDLLICHDVIEHIPSKTEFMTKCKSLLKEGGIIFMSFPAWQMPFGGHQQICHNRLLAHLPFFHLLPTAMYKKVLEIGGENQSCIRELMSIKQTQCPIELFLKSAKAGGFDIINWTPWFINPHYEVKFGLRPRLLWRAIGGIPYLRNFFTPSSFYILKVGA